MLQRGKLRMTYKKYDRVLLKDGHEASIVEVFFKIKCFLRILIEMETRIRKKSQRNKLKTV